jgi:hypothetical protein
MRKLKAGVLFCPENGVKTFPTPYVVVFADFQVPRKKRAEAVAPAEAPEAEAPAVAPVAVEAVQAAEVPADEPAQARWTSFVNMFIE